MPLSGTPLLLSLLLRMIAGPTEVSLFELVADGRRRTILLCAPRDNLRMRPPRDSCIASAIAFAGITGGEVGALNGGRAGSGRNIELGSEDDNADMAGMPSGEVREGIFGWYWELAETRLTLEELLLIAEDGAVVRGTDVTTC